MKNSKKLALNSHLASINRQTDINRQCKQMCKQGSIIIHHCRFHIMRSVSVKVRLFTAFCSSVFSAQFWSHYRRCIMQKLMVAYHTVLKTPLGVSRYETSSHTCVVHRVPHCAILIRQRTYLYLALSAD